MRMLQKGKRFMHVPADTFPKDWPKQSGDPPPTFSEAFLYDTVGKGDARFILGVAEEYDHIIKLLGDEVVRELLTVKMSRAGRDRLRIAMREALRVEGVMA